MSRRRNRLLTWLFLFLFDLPYRWLLPALAQQPMTHLCAAEEERFAEPADRRDGE